MNKVIMNRGNWTLVSEVSCEFQSSVEDTQYSVSTSLPAPDAVGFSVPKLPPLTATLATGEKLYAKVPFSVAEPYIVTKAS